VPGRQDCFENEFKSLSIKHEIAFDEKYLRD
jgi:hypothetical protein